ncbi:MAG TPA: MBL fold metallo-hydrolase [Gemmatimonadaceae bacterium]|nr:MBL fold metallo-hydrolase [Gemmatimonadaceae bacterium]
MPLLPLVESRTVGSLRIHALQAGLQRLDGGAMFGVVPKSLWERKIPADDKNRIPLGMRCLLIEHPDALVLVDTGLGDKESEKFHTIYGVENAPVGASGPTQLESALAEAGFAPADVTLVINTHLHFDHAGGNTRRGEDGAAVPAFPNARYVVRRGEWDWAHHTNERTAASYFPHNFDPVQAAGRLELVDDDRELLSGISLRHTPGHTPHHQGVLVESGAGRLFYLADLAPTAAHVPLPWIMGYDVEPLVTLETKRRVWAEAAAEGWTVMFEHDAVHAFGRIVADGRGYGCEVPGGT